MAKEQWSRAMLILFKPWRNPSDLKEDNESWVQAYERTVFPSTLEEIMQNMLVLHECKDARDADAASRQRLSFLPRHDLPGAVDDIEWLQLALQLEKA